ncbi:hypothetical protein D3C76_1749640 [compost metagenome]
MPVAAIVAYPAFLPIGDSDAVCGNVQSLPAFQARAAIQTDPHLFSSSDLRLLPFRGNLYVQPSPEWYGTQDQP